MPHFVTFIFVLAISLTWSGYSSAQSEANPPAGASSGESTERSRSGEAAGIQAEARPAGSDGEENSGFQDFSDDTVIDDSDPDPGPDENPDDSSGELSETGYIMSRFTGTFIGFGIGHALQGRWLSTGWLYTLGNFLMFPVVTWIWPLYGRGKRYRAGAGTWALIHGIEIWDIWSHEDSEAGGPVVSVRPLSFFGPDNRYYGLALRWKL